MIRKAKFPRRASVVAYQQIASPLRRFLTSNSGDLRYFDGIVDRLNDKARREVGYNRDEALRCIAAIEAFKATFSKAKLSKMTFLAGPSDIQMKVENVSINVRLDPPIVERRDDGRAFSGGCVMLLANSPDARKNIEERTKSVAAIAHWTLESDASNVEPLARLCMSFDAFGGRVVKAPSAIDRLRKRVAASCREAADSWDRVDPPAGYDGPDWR